MSRNIPDHPTAPLTYEAVNTFKRVALLEGKSLFLPGGVSLWTPDRFEPLVEHYVENLILSNDVGGFWKKLPFQIGHVECPGESAALFAEIFWIVTLASSSMTVTACVRLPLASHTISARSMGSGVGFGACSI